MHGASIEMISLKDATQNDAVWRGSHAISS